MKKLAVIAVIIGMIMTLSTFSAYAMGMGGGMGGGMSGGRGGNGTMGNFGSGLLDWFQKWRNGNANANPPGQERKQLQELDRQHDEDAAYLKYQIQRKEKQLDALLNSSHPDIDKVRALHKDIRELRSAADQEQRNYELEAGKMNPGYQSGNSDRWTSHGSPGRSVSGDMGHGAGMGSGGYRQGQGR